MRIPNNVKCIPPWINRIPLFKNTGGLALYPYIFLNAVFYNDLLSKNPKPKTVYALIHEQEHIRRAKIKGALLWLLLYGLIPSFRINEELEADREAMKYWKSQKLKYDFDSRARSLSSSMYLWANSRKNAKQKLLKIWGMI
jgi:hypothetical protein